MRWDEMNRDMWLPCMQHDLVTYPRKCMTWHDKWQAGSWVSRIPYREQVQVHASTNPSTTSSVASSGNIGRWGVAPLLTPFDSGFPTHTHPSHPIRSHPIPFWFPLQVSGGERPLWRLAEPRGRSERHIGHQVTGPGRGVGRSAAGTANVSLGCGSIGFFWGGYAFIGGKHLGDWYVDLFLVYWILMSYVKSGCLVVDDVSNTFWYITPANIGISWDWTNKCGCLLVCLVLLFNWLNRQDKHQTGLFENRVSPVFDVWENVLGDLTIIAWEHMGYTIFILDFAKLDVYVVLYWIYWLHLQYLICWKLEPINSMDWWVYQSYVDITTGHPPLVLLHQSIDDSQWKMVWLTGMTGDWPNLHRLAGILQGERSCSAYHLAKRSVPCLQGKEHSFNQSSEVEQMVMLGQELEYRCRGTCRSGASYFVFVWKWYQNRFIFKKNTLLRVICTVTFFIVSDISSGSI